jgi:site-specific DNA recombinase
MKDEPTTKKALVYIRVSTSKQADKDIDPEGYSIPAQRGECYRRATDLGAEIIEEFVDRGESAKTSDRPGLKAMMSLLRERRDIDYVIVHKIDRLARNREDDVVLNMAIRKAGAHLVSVTETIDDTPTGKLVHGLMATVAEFYSSNNGHEALKGMTQKAKVGGTPGQAPIGYLNVRQVIENRVIRTIDIDPERAPHVQWAFQAYATGEWTIKALTAELADRGLRSRQIGDKPPSRLQRSRVAAMLSHRYYIGKVSFRGMEYDGRHPPLVSDQLFYKVQDILSSRRHAVERRRTHDNYLKGTVFCGRCHSRLCMTLANGHGGSYLYFFCSGRQRGNGCDQSHLLADKVEEEVERFYGTVQLEPSRIDSLRQRLHEELAALEWTREREAKRQKRRVDRLVREQDKLMQGLYAGLPLDLFKQEQARIARETAEAKLLLEGTKVRFKKVKETIEKALEVSANLHDMYVKGSPQVRRLLNQGIFERLELQTGFMRKPRVVSATLTDPFANLLAQDLADRASREGEPLELLFSGQGSNTDCLVPGVGLEPTSPFGQWCLRPSRIPVPPSRRTVEYRDGASALEVAVVLRSVRVRRLTGRERLSDPIEGLGGLVLQGQLGSLEQPLEPPQDLGVRQGQLLQGAVADVRGQVVQLFVELAGEGLAQLVGDLPVDPPEVIDRPGLRTDAPSLLQDLPHHSGDAKQALRIEGEAGSRYGVFGRTTRVGI